MVKFKRFRGILNFVWIKIEMSLVQWGEGGGGGGEGNRQPSLTFQFPVTLDKRKNYKSKREFGKSY